MTLLKCPFDSVGHALAMTVRAAKENGEKEIHIPKNTYHVYAKEAATPAICISNHGHNGFKSTALAIENMSDLTVDCEGSEFILHGAMDFAIINRSKNVTVKNLTVRCADSCNFQGKVIEATDEYVKIQLEEHPELFLFGDTLLQRFENNQYEAVSRTLDYVTETKEPRRDTGDNNFRVPINQMKKSLCDGVLTLYGAQSIPPVGDTIVFAMARRCNQAFCVSHSENIVFENITVNTCWGMGFIVQKTTNVTIRACRVTPYGDNCWSAGQDATHFVNCRGTITVEDCLFENQLDDAINLHGIYTIVDKVAKDKILVRYGHHQSRGIDIYSVGDRIQLLERESQQPLAFATVSDVDVLNADYTSLTLRDVDGEICENMIVENLSDESDAYIRNNIIRNNRARGMLLASKGHVEITGNHFHSGGSAIQFQSDPLFWLECGSVNDVTISDNFFDNCCLGDWGKAVININKRKKTLENFYYHDTIRIQNNRFVHGEDTLCVYAANVRNLMFEGNEYPDAEPVRARHAFVNEERFE